MKRIIRGETYDTETAPLLCGLTCNDDFESFNWHDTGLYQTRGGAFFLAGEGNAKSMWAERLGGNCRGPGRGIRPVSADEALEILERENEVEEIERLFGSMPEASASEPYTLRIDPALGAKLEQASKTDARSVNAIVCEALEAHFGL